MWIDDVYACQSPRETAECLLGTDPDSMQWTTGVDIHRLANLSDRLIDLVLDVRAADSVSLKPDHDKGSWESHFSSRYAYEPSVAAGLFGLSAAIAAAVREETLGAAEIAAATAAFDRMPLEYVEDKSSLEAHAASFRRYMLVPTVDAVRRIWIAVALSRMTEGPEAIRVREVMRKVWREFAELPPMGQVGRETLIKGLVLMQVASVLDPATSARPALDFSDLGELAGQSKSAQIEHGGRAAVAVAFQKRLLALFASFNCRIVSAGPGDPLGDIYLELPEGDFVLVDAKSTGATEGYALPKKDQDALARYVEDASRVLPLGRRICAVLIVGPRPDASLGPRLEALEARTGTDFRFSTALEMVRFREAFPGGSLHGLDDALHGSSSVLPVGWWQSLVDRTLAENRRLAQYLKDGLT